MKKLFALVMVISLLLVGCSGETKQTIGEIQENLNIDPQTAGDDEIKQIIEGLVTNFDVTTINEIKVNENMGLADGSCIVLPHLKWDRKNGADQTKSMLEMYSDRLARDLAEYNISDLTIFWEVPYHLEGDNIAKFNYTRIGEGLAINDIWFAPLLN